MTYRLNSTEEALSLVADAMADTDSPCLNERLASNEIIVCLNGALDAEEDQRCGELRENFLEVCWVGPFWGREADYCQGPPKHRRLCHEVRLLATGGVGSGVDEANA